ncbi:MAG: phosphonate metabolism protein/1,5-bisphosphokinase (PRPP-forming) PhnN [Sphingomonadales bacterium]|nr:phosphonate metabolism protein/1,5-bisphosphokinase (PRPP-forming) PhnN [Sphingomonadales bacterium]
MIHQTPPAQNARLFAVVGPSGAGKDTLLRLACAQVPGLHLVRRVITRPPSAATEPFESASEEAFAERQKAGEFALDWPAHGLRYGIPRTELAPLERGETVLFNGSRKALPQALQAFPGMGVILITAPVEVLADRLAARGRESAEDIAARLDRAGFELPGGIRGRVVINDTTPEVGAARLIAALQLASA